MCKAEGQISEQACLSQSRDLHSFPQEDDNISVVYTDREFQILDSFPHNFTTSISFLFLTTLSKFLFHSSTKNLHNNIINTFSSHILKPNYQKIVKYKL